MAFAVAQDDTVQNTCAMLTRFRLNSSSAAPQSQRQRKECDND